MTDHRVTDLSYGHFGQATYDPKKKEWIFTRQPGIRNQLYSISTPRVSIPASLQILESELLAPSKVLRPYGRTLSTLYPELTPALPSCPPLLHASAVITSLTSIHDPTVSTLIGFGRAIDIDNQKSRARTISIVAVAAGEAGESVKLIQVNEERIGWSATKGVRLVVPQVRNAETAWWHSDAGPVKQICFGDGDTGKTWLAIRLQSSTYFLRPLYHRMPVRSTTSHAPNKFKLQPPSRIDPNYIVTIPASRTGGASHAGIAFNSWYDRQCAIVDQKGHWTVWDLEGQKKKRRLFNATAGRSGDIVDSASTKNHSDRDIEADGWGSVCWARDVNTLVVCNRRNLAIFDLRADPPTRLKTPNLDLIRTTNWILDIKRSPVNDKHVFVATTTQVFQLEISGGPPHRDGAHVLQSWRHFRNENDISLRTEVLGVDEAAYVFLYSRLNSLVAVYQFSHVPDTPNIPISVSDPYIMTLPLELCTTPRNESTGGRPSSTLTISTLSIHPLRYITRSNFTPSGLGQTYVEKGVKFFKLFVLCNDLSVHDCFYTSGMPGGGCPPSNESFGDGPGVQAPGFKGKNAGWTNKSTRRVVERGFIVEDGDEDDPGEEIIGHPSPLITRIRGPSPVTTPLGDEWTLNFGSIYDQTFAVNGRGYRDSHSGYLEDRLGAYKTTLEGRLAGKRDTGFLPIETFFELHVPPSYFEDVDRASTDLQALLDLRRAKNAENDPEMSLAFRNLVPSTFGFPFQKTLDDNQEGETGITLSRLYDRLVDVWVAALPTSAVGKLRLAKERIVRTVAAELFLSNIGVTLEGAERSAVTDLDDISLVESGTLALPFRSSAASSTDPKGKGKQRQERSSSSEPSSQRSADTGFAHERQVPFRPSLSHSPKDIRTPEPTPSLYSRSSQQSRPLGAEDEACTRLRAYTTLSSLPPLSLTMSNVLAHWTVGGDPSKYSWEATRRALAPSDDEREGTSGTESTSQTRKSREERIRKRQHLDTTATSASSSQPMRAPRSWGSKPADPLTSSQTDPHDEKQIASQIVSGPFGGRPTVRKRRKRAAGF